MRASLFLIAIIDINLFVKNSQVSGYMDDFIQTTSNSDLQEAGRLAQNDAQAVVDYFKLNRLAVQGSKTALMVVRHNKTAREDLKFEIDGKEIAQQNSFKILGIEIDNQLSFESHVGVLVKRVRQTQAGLRRVAGRFPKNLGVMIINAMLVSKMTYGSFLFLSNKKHRKKLQKMLNDSIRFVARKKRIERVNMKELSKEMGIPTLKKVYQKQTLMEMVKMQQKESLFVKTYEKTRNFTEEKLRPFGKKNIAKKSCLALMVKLWNAHSKRLKVMDAMDLKKFVKKEFI